MREQDFEYGVDTPADELVRKTFSENISIAKEWLNRWSMNPRKLSQRVKGLIGNAEMYDEILLSAISPWEFSKLLEKKRVGISCDPEDWINTALDMPKLRLVPLSPVLSYR